MDEAEGQAIEVRTEREGTRYILPPRHPGAARRPLGWILIGLGIFVTIFMGFWMGGPLSGGMHEQGPGKWLPIGFGLLGLPGLVVGVALLIAGLLVLRGRCGWSEVVVSRDQIIAIDHLGPVRFRRTWSTKDIRSFVIADGIQAQSGKAAPTAAEDWGMLRVEPAKPQQMGIAPFYPRSILRELATHLSKATGTVGGGLIRETTVAIPVVEEYAGIRTSEDEVPLPQPAGSDIVVQELENGFAITVPPSGLWKGSKGLFAFALMWNAFCLVFFGIMFTAAANGNSQDPPPWPVMVLFTLVFCGIGIVMLLGAINMGRRRIFIAKMGDRLAFRQVGPFGVKEEIIPLVDVGAVCVGPSGMEINNVPVMELQVFRKNGPKKGLLSQRRTEELDWLAGLLRKNLGVPSRIV